MVLITRDLPVHGQSRKQTHRRSHSAPRQRPDWDSTQSDLSSLRLTPEQQEQRKRERVSRHALRLADLREKLRAAEQTLGWHAPLLSQADEDTQHRHQHAPQAAAAQDAFDEEDLSLKHLGSMRSASTSAEGPASRQHHSSSREHISMAAHAAGQHQRAVQQQDAAAHMHSQQQQQGADRPPSRPSSPARAMALVGNPAEQEPSSAPPAAPPAVPLQQYEELQGQLQQLHQDYSKLASQFQQYMTHTTSVISRMQIQMSTLLSGQASTADHASQHAALPSQPRTHVPPPPPPAAASVSAYLSAPSIPSPYRTGYPTPEPRAAPALLHPEPGHPTTSAAATAAHRSRPQVHEESAVLPSFAAMRRSQQHAAIPAAAPPPYAATSSHAAPSAPPPPSHLMSATSRPSFLPDLSPNKENAATMRQPRKLPPGFMPGTLPPTQPISSKAPAASMRYFSPAGTVPSSMPGAQLPVRDANSSLSLAAHLSAAGVRQAQAVRQFGI